MEIVQETSFDRNRVLTKPIAGSCFFLGQDNNRYMCVCPFVCPSVDRCVVQQDAPAVGTASRCDRDLPSPVCVPCMYNYVCAYIRAICTYALRVLASSSTSLYVSCIYERVHIAIDIGVCAWIYGVITLESFRDIFQYYGKFMILIC